MFNKKLISNIIALIGKHKQGSYDKRTTHPTREWMLGLCMFVSIILVGSVQSAHVFIQYQHISTEGGVFKEKIVTYSRPLADKALASYTKRKESFNLLQEHMVPSSDVTNDSLPTIPTASSTQQVRTQEVATTTEEIPQGSIELAN